MEIDRAWAYSYCINRLAWPKFKLAPCKSTWPTQLPPIPYTEIKIQDPTNVNWPIKYPKHNKSTKATYPKHPKQTNKQERQQEISGQAHPAEIDTQIYAFQ
jgi:hypothetical protein